MMIEVPAVGAVMAAVPAVVTVPGVFGGAVVGFGLWLVLLGLKGKAVLSGGGSKARGDSQAGGGIKAVIGTGNKAGGNGVIAKKMLIGIVAGAAVYLITSWIAASLLASGAVIFFWGKLKSQSNILADKGDAIASWIEMLYTTIAAGGGFEKAIAVSARSAPLSIRREVEALAARIEVVPLPEALASFAREVAHPACDKVATALTLASARGAQNLVGLLRSQAASVRQEGQLLRSQQAGRAKFLTSARIVLGATLTVALGIYLFDDGYLEPYGSPFGQIMLCVVGAGFMGGYGLLIRMGKAKPLARYFEMTDSSLSTGKTSESIQKTPESNGKIPARSRKIPESTRGRET